MKGGFPNLDWTVAAWAHLPLLTSSEVQPFAKYSEIAFTVFNVLKLSPWEIGANRN